MTIKSFDLLQPRSLPEAVEQLAKHGDEARVIGGGTTLVILMKQRALYYPYLVDLQTIPGLNEIKNEADGVRIGALVTHRAVELSPAIRRSFPAVAEAFSHIGNVRVRETASVGGNLAHADYRLDPPPPLLVLGAEITAFGPNGSRIIALKNFFQGMYETALGPGDILVDVKIPFSPANSRAVYLRYSSLSATDWPCLGVAAFMTKDNGRCKELRLALGGVAATPMLISGLEFASDQKLDETVVEKVLSVVDEQISPFSDLRGSEWYKRRMARLFTKKAITQLSAN
ncbi:MAG TPA: xanthine dehydrogenase family protein subunit M [Candidatus Binatia bacterium]|jgi:carbon-monoxide dehydrogenase medium subunit|nr:xanthine dehydrogenase family protein subunit M [Candidatus Binatia bacterium]